MYSFKRHARKVAQHFSCQALLSRILCLVMALGTAVFVYSQVAACMQSQPSYNASKSSHPAEQRKYAYYCHNLVSGYHWISSMEHDLENRSAVSPALEAAAKQRSQLSSHELAVSTSSALHASPRVREQEKRKRKTESVLASARWYLRLHACHYETLIPAPRRKHSGG